jgi:hypothetical protein
MKIILRPLKPEKDCGLIYDSYPKGVFHGGLVTPVKSKKEWMAEFYIRMKYELATCQIHIACLEDDPDTILGYSIIKNGPESFRPTLLFVYVKDEFRNKKIGTLLTKNKFISVEQSTMTKVGQAILAHLTKEDPDVHETKSASD